MEKREAREDYIEIIYLGHNCGELSGTEPLLERTPAVG